MNTYTPDSNRVIHYANVDFTTRNFIDTVHLVQYDNKLPILAVRMFQNGVEYDVSDADRVQLRYGKRDRTFVILDALGLSENGAIIYFELTDQITVEAGEHTAIVDVIFEESVMNNASSPIPISIDKNPVTDDMIESLTDYKCLVEYRNEALEYMNTAEEYKDNAHESAMYLLAYLEEGLHYQFVNELPVEPDVKTVYLILKEGETDKYNQWVYGRDDQWHLIGISQIDVEEVYHNFEGLLNQEWLELKSVIQETLFSTTKTIPETTWSSEYPYTVNIEVTGVKTTSWVYIYSNGALENYVIKDMSQSANELTLKTAIRPIENINIDILVINL